MQKNRKMATKRRTFTDAQRRQCCMNWMKAQQTGCTFTMFCKKCNVTPTSIRNWLKKFKMAMPSRTRNTTRKSVNRKSTSVMASMTNRNNNKKNATKANMKSPRTVSSPMKATRGKNNNMRRNTARKMVRR